MMLRYLNLSSAQKYINNVVSKWLLLVKALSLRPPKVLPPSLEDEVKLGS